MEFVQIMEVVFCTHLYLFIFLKYDEDPKRPLKAKQLFNRSAFKGPVHESRVSRRG